MNERHPQATTVATNDVEIGDLAAPTAKAGRPNLIIASFNIRYAVGRFLISSGILRRAGINLPANRAKRIEQNIKAAALAFSQGVLMPPADILALQETDRQTARAGGHHVAAELASKLDMGWVHVPARLPRNEKPKSRQWWLAFEEQITLNDPGDAGIALLSRVPLTDISRIDLPWKDCAWRPHWAMGASMQLGSVKLRIFNVHIDPHATIHGQHDQLEALLAHAEKQKGPTIVLGDFNTLSRQKCIETRHFMESRAFSTPFPDRTATWRGALIRLHADWIFVRDVSVARWGVARPLNVSDHWPIWCEIEPK
jgi:endonuclease/exonuclease/phosphatase family metal-dependent hydrolase